MRTEIHPVATRRTVLSRTRGDRQPVEHLVTHRAAVLIRFPSETEFPLAAEIEDGGRREIYRRLAEDGLLYRRARLRGRKAGGRAPDPLLDDDCTFDPASALFGGRAVPDGGEPFPASHVPQALLGAIGDRHWINPFGPAGQAEPDGVVDDGIGQADARAARIAARMLVFGGALWIAVPEPVWRVGVGGVVLAPTSWSGEGSGFRLDRLEAAKTEARYRHAGAIRVHGRVVALDPSLLRFDEGVSVARFVGCHAIENDAALMQMLPSDAVDTFLALRRRAAGPWPATMAEAARLVALARSYAEAFERIGINDFGRRAGMTPADSLSRAFERWEEIGAAILDEADEDAMASLGST